MTRREQLERLIAATCKGSAREFARRIDRADAQVHQIRKGLRNIGDGMARQIEMSFGLPGGWLDTDEPVPSGQSAGTPPAQRHGVQEQPSAYTSARMECHRIIDDLPMPDTERALLVLRLVQDAGLAKSAAQGYSAAAAQKSKEPT